MYVDLNNHFFLGRLVKDFLEEKKRPALLNVLKKLGTFDIQGTGQEEVATWRQLTDAEVKNYR